MIINFRVSSLQVLFLLSIIFSLILPLMIAVCNYSIFEVYPTSVRSEWTDVDDSFQFEVGTESLQSNVGARGINSH